MKKFLIKYKEFFFWLGMFICFIGLLLCNQYAGYKQAEKNIMKSCISNDSFEIEGIKFDCIKCPSKKEK